MTDVKTKAAAAFEEKFGAKPEMMSYAPGRVNIIGEHTDYNDGFVMPCAIKFGTAIAARKNGTDRMRVLAVDVNGEYDEFPVTADMDKHESKTWSNYLRGVTKLICERGCKFEGLDVAIAGDVPLGAGLSSSASLEVAFGNLISQAYGLGIELQDIALIGQAAEAFIGCKCGIMDQTISACGKKGCVMRLDCRTLDKQHVKVPEGLEILIVNSNVKHALVGGEYNERRAQCEKAAAVLGVKALRDATMDLLDAQQAERGEVTSRAR